MTARSRDVREEIKGPPTKAPEQAIQGFVRKDGAGLDRRRAGAERPQEGRFLRRPDREWPGRAAKRSSRDIHAGHHSQFPLA